MKQKGYTLIELLVALPIGVVVLAAIVSGIFQVVHGTIDIRSETVAQADMENAVHWLTRDVMMGQSIWRTWDPITGQGTELLQDSPATDNVTLTWTDCTGGLGNEHSHYVVYAHSGTELRREYDSVDNTTIVGRNLSDVKFSLSGDLVTVTLTSTHEKLARSTVTRKYVIEMRARGD